MYKASADLPQDVGAASVSTSPAAMPLLPRYPSRSLRFVLTTSGLKVPSCIFWMSSRISSAESATENVSLPKVSILSISFSKDALIDWDSADSDSACSAASRHPRMIDRRRLFSAISLAQYWACRGVSAADMTEKMPAMPPTSSRPLEAFRFSCRDIASSGFPFSTRDAMAVKSNLPLRV